jgi:hypothetical protein
MSSYTEGDRFDADAARERMMRESREAWQKPLGSSLDAPEPREDSEVSGAFSEGSAEAARQRMLDRHANAWREPLTASR